MSPSSSIRRRMDLKEEPLAPDMAQKTQVFFFLYFAMTGMHALHMIIGIVSAVLAYVAGESRGVLCGVCRAD